MSEECGRSGLALVVCCDDPQIEGEGRSKLAPRQQRGANGSDLGILSEGKGILHVNSEVADRILDLAMAEEDLDGAQVAGRPIDD